MSALKPTRHYVERAVERGISQTEVRDVLLDLKADTPIGEAARRLLAAGEPIVFRRRGIALVLAGVGADVRIVTTYRSGKR